MSEQDRDKIVSAVVKAAQAVSLSGGNGGAVAGGGRSTGNGNGLAQAVHAAAPALHSAARESSTQVPMLLRQPGSGSALPRPKQPAGVMGPPSPQAALAAAVAAASGNSPVKRQLQQLLLQSRGEPEQQPRSPGGAKTAAMLSGLAEVLRQAMDKPAGGSSRSAAAAGGGSSSSRHDAASLMHELAEVLKHVDKLGVADAAAVPGSSAGVQAAAAAAAAAVVLPRISEYFGCVTSVPQLSPGEIRAAGVTAHPNVVATYVRQRDGASLQALQPVSEKEGCRWFASSSVVCADSFLWGCVHAGA
jgi:hypothetical protein